MGVKAWYIITLLLAISLTVPLIQSVLQPMTDTGGIIQVATNQTAQMGLGGDWDLAIWKLWAIIILIGLVILLVRALRKKEQE